MAIPEGLVNPVVQLILTIAPLDKLILEIVPIVLLFETYI